MMATNIGCVGHRNLLDAVEYAANSKLPPHNPLHVNHNNPRRSDRLHDKEAILFHNGARKRVTGTSKRTQHQPDDDDDWGVIPSRRQRVASTKSITPMAMPMAMTPTMSNSSNNNNNNSNINTHAKSKLGVPVPARSPSSNPNRLLLTPSNTGTAAAAPSGGSRAGGPLAKNTGTTRNGTTPPTASRNNLSTSRVITPKGGTEAAESRRLMHTNRGNKIRRPMEQERVKEEEAMMDITSRHHNQVRGNNTMDQGPALFESARRKAATPERERKPRRHPSPEKKTKKNEVTLFEHSRKEYDRRDKRRMEAIVHTVRSMEASQYDSSSAEGASSSLLDLDEVSSHKRTAKVKQNKGSKEEGNNTEEEEEEESWNTEHYLAEAKLNAALDPVQQFRDIYKPDYDKHNTSQTSASSKPQSITAWGHAAMVSDLSYSSNSAIEHPSPMQPATANAIPKQLPHPMNATSQRIQQALLDAKNRIYPEGAMSVNTSYVAAASQCSGPNGPFSISTTGERGDKYNPVEQDENDTYDQAARSRLSAGKPSSSQLGDFAMGTTTTAITSPCQMPYTRSTELVDRNSTVHNETPRHSNTQKTKSEQSFGMDVSQGVSHTKTEKIERARSKSPDATRALVPPKRLSRRRSKTPEGLRKPHAQPGGCALQTPRSSKGFAFGRARSTTPTRPSSFNKQTSDFSNHTKSMPSSVKDQPRSLTPNRLEMARRRPTPGLMLGESRRYIDEAEEKLMAIQYQREIARNPDSHEEDFYRRPRVIPKRGGKSFSGSGDKLFGGTRRGIMKSFSGSGDKLLGGHRRGGIMKKGTEYRQSPSHLTNKGLGFAGSSRGTGHYQGSPRDPPSKRWFGKQREEYPSQSISSAGSRARKKGLAGQLGSFLGSEGGGSRGKLPDQDSPSINSSEASVLSARMRKHMMTFDNLMRAIENDKKNELGAEFAVVELGDDENVVQTHAILMNRDDVEDQLSLLGSNDKRLRKNRRNV